MADRQLQIPEVLLPGFRLGRHIWQDSRSLQFRMPATAAVPKSVRWERRIPILDQNTAGPGGHGLGSCTGHSGIGLLGTEPFYSSLPEEARRLLTDATAVRVYGDATRIDPFPGSWQPDDTGSTGLSVAKVLRDMGWISGYRTATTLDEYHTAIQAGPFTLGTMWFTGMDTPDAEGIVRPTGPARGGHQYVCDEYDARRDLWWFTNHWSKYWGKAGRFAYDTPVLQRLLSMQGDVTIFVPITSPAPAPTPVPDVPAPVPQPDSPLDGFPAAQIKPWLSGAKSYTVRERTARTALAGWLAAQGLEL